MHVIFTRDDVYAYDDSHAETIRNVEKCTMMDVLSQIRDTYLLDKMEGLHTWLIGTESRAIAMITYPSRDIVLLQPREIYSRPLENREPLHAHYLGRVEPEVWLRNRHEST